MSEFNQDGKMVSV